MHLTKSLQNWVGNIQEIKMNNILIFPKKEKRTKPLPRQRVFYIGFRYVGPFLCKKYKTCILEMVKKEVQEHGH